jgi:hypothetical protein
VTIGGHDFALADAYARVHDLCCRSRAEPFREAGGSGLSLNASASVPKFLSLPGSFQRPVVSRASVFRRLAVAGQETAAEALIGCF